MKNRRSASAFLAVSLVACGSLAWGFGGCSNSSAVPTGDTDSGGGDASPPVTADTGTGDAGSKDAQAVDSAAVDTGLGGPVVITGIEIVAQDGTSPSAAPGDALPLKLVYLLSDGSIQDGPTGTGVKWTVPQTVTAQDPNDAGPNSVLPTPGAQPTAFFVANPYRPDRTDYPGVLFVIDPGTVADAGVTVTAEIADGGGTVTTVVPIGPAPVGDPDAGANLFLSVLTCYACHGTTAAGSPPVLMDDGGLLLVDGSAVYDLQGTNYPYPAPGLNNTNPDDAGPNVGADPAWNAALVGMAAQGDLDNNGVALRRPMPDWLGKTGVGGKTLTGQDFANIYAWLKTQTH